MFEAAGISFEDGGVKRIESDNKTVID